MCPIPVLTTSAQPPTPAHSENLMLQPPLTPCDTPPPHRPPEKAQGPVLIFLQLPLPRPTRKHLECPVHPLAFGKAVLPVQRTSPCPSHPPSLPGYLQCVFSCLSLVPPALTPARPPRRRLGKLPPRPQHAQTAASPLGRSTAEPRTPPGWRPPSAPAARRALRAELSD